MTAFWDTATCSLVQVEQHFRNVLIALMVEAVSISEALVIFNKTTRRRFPECFHLHTRRSENLKCHENQTV
jgi:hypothetical protein